MFCSSGARVFYARSTFLRLAPICVRRKARMNRSTNFGILLTLIMICGIISRLMINKWVICGMALIISTKSQEPFPNVPSLLLVQWCEFLCISGGSLEDAPRARLRGNSTWEGCGLSRKERAEIIICSLHTIAVIWTVADKKMNWRLSCFPSQPLLPEHFYTSLAIHNCPASEFMLSFVASF